MGRENQKWTVLQWLLRILWRWRLFCFIYIFYKNFLCLSDPPAFAPSSKDVFGLESPVLWEKKKGRIQWMDIEMDWQTSVTRSQFSQHTLKFSPQTLWIWVLLLGSAIPLTAKIHTPLKSSLFGVRKSRKRSVHGNNWSLGAQGMEFCWYSWCRGGTGSFYWNDGNKQGKQFHQSNLWVCVLVIFKLYLIMCVQHL